MFSDGALAVFVECVRKPNGCAVGQRTKASIEVIKARIDKLDGDDETAQHIGDRAVRFDVRTKFVAAKKRVTAKKGITFAFEIKILWQPRNLVAVFFHPARKMRRFSSSLFVSKIARYEFFPNSEPSVGGKNHIGKLWLRRHQMDFTIQLRQGRVKAFPLLLGKGCFRTPRTAHPWVDFVLDAIMIW